MRDTRELLRETRDRVAPPPDVLGSLERRRHRREQVRRGSAAVVACVVALVGLGGWFVVGRDDTKVPVVDPSPSELGIFADVRGWIAYGDESGIWAVDPANPDPKPVLLDAVGGFPVAWSSDGSKLLIYRDDSSRSGPDGLLVLHADGTATDLETGGFDASFTPDGSHVIYAGDDGIYSVEANGGSARRLYDDVGVGFATAVSPDGSRLAFFEGHGDAENSLWVMNVDGTDKRRILGEEEAGRTPFSLQWSPDGTRLAFSTGTGRYPDTAALGVVNADGSGLAFLDVEVPEMERGAGPYWSPDGTHLAFATGPQQSPSLAIVRADGTGLQVFSVFTGLLPGPWNPLDPAPTGSPPTTTTG